jgi:hypothetical protein
VKIVKLNRRYKMYDKGYTHAMRWASWNSRECPLYENSLTQLYGWHGYTEGKSVWYAEFGSRVYNRHGSARPYFIYVKDESVITAALLMAS